MNSVHEWMRGKEQAFIQFSHQLNGQSTFIDVLYQLSLYSQTILN